MRHIQRRLAMAAKAIRDDQGIALKHPHGITGYQAEQNRLVAISVAKEAKEDAIQTDDWLYADHIGPRDDKWPPKFINRIKKIVARNFNIEVIDLDSERRGIEIVVPRHVAIYLCKTLTLKSLPEIGRNFGGRDHTTILAGIRRNIKRMIASKEFCQTVIELQDRLEQDLADWRANV